MMHTKSSAIHPDFPWLLHSDAGLFCVPGNFYLDPKVACYRAVISHAHADHFPRRVGEVHATPATLALGPDKEKNKRIPHPFREKFKLEDVEISFFPAGHVPGSSQVLLEYKGQSILYSGDLFWGENKSSEPAEIPAIKPDLLLCESTFGWKPEHENAKESIQNLVIAAGLKPLLIAAYPLGKTQRITLLLNELFPEMPVFLHPLNFSMSRRCAALGYLAGNFKPWRRKEADKSSRFAFIVSPRIFSSYAADYHFYKVMATGWNKKHEWTWMDANLPISDHADANSLKEYIRQIQPGKIVFVHGKPDLLGDFCDSMGISYSVPAG